jgi:hypothetical protein
MLSKMRRTRQSALSVDVANCYRARLERGNAVNKPRLQGPLLPSVHAASEF